MGPLMSLHDVPGSAETIGRRAVAFALRAPSVHNTQPWRWGVSGLTLDLYADRSRQLACADPTGRNLTISCGAALHYAVVGAASTGWASEVALLPDPADRDHLATVRLHAGDRTRRDRADADLLARRTTDRRRFIGWPVPDRLLDTLAAEATFGSASAIAVTNPADRLSVELLLSTARSVERADERIVAEQRRWTALGGFEGVPAVNAQPATAGLRPTWPSRFDPGVEALDPMLTAPADGLVVVTTLADTATCWLDAGRLLCRLWAAALDRGLSVIPLSQPIEVDDTRTALRVGVLRTDAHPQLVLRLGWQELSRSPLPPTPRRTLDDVLRA